MRRPTSEYSVVALDTNRFPLVILDAHNQLTLQSFANAVNDISKRTYVCIGAAAHLKSALVYLASDFVCALVEIKRKNHRSLNAARPTSLQHYASDVFRSVVVVSMAGKLRRRESCYSCSDPVFGIIGSISVPSQNSS